jgi:hypothetical protein
MNTCQGVVSSSSSSSSSMETSGTLVRGSLESLVTFEYYCDSVETTDTATTDNSNND